VGVVGFIFGRRGEFISGGCFGVAGFKSTMGLLCRRLSDRREFFQIAQQQIRIVWIDAVNRGVFLRRHSGVRVRLHPSLADARRDASRP
jgi:hypothetical protein